MCWSVFTDDVCVYKIYVCFFKCVYVCLSVFPMTGLLILMMCFYCVANVL